MKAAVACVLSARDVIFRRKDESKALKDVLEEKSDSVSLLTCFEAS